jgi:hypothetical protein
MPDLPPPATVLDEGRDSVLARPADGQIVYRVLAGDQPELWDFKSHAERGDDRLRGEPAILWRALSVFDREDRAWRLVRRGLGRGVAAVELHSEDEVHVARTRRRSGHYSVWGEAERLVARASALAKPEA